MDLERIKQNLRLRSGRKKPKRTPAKTNVPSIHQEPAQQPHSLPNGHIAETEQIQQESEEREHKVEEPSGSVFLEEPVVEEVHNDQDTVSVDNIQQAEEQLNSLPGSVSEHAPSETQPAKDTANITEQEDKPDDINPPEESHTMPEPQPATAYPSSEPEDFDLSPPKPRPKPPSIESLAELLFSSSHLNALLHNPPQLTSFSTFLQKYLPNTSPLLSQYLETQKAIKAVEYANAVAYGFKPQVIGHGVPTEVRKSAATLDPEFKAISDAAFGALVGIALPQYITYQLIKVCSECLTNEITGRQSTAVMSDLVGGLSEIFCLTDPHQEDNPIIYASEEFYRLTGYGEEDVIGNNCRFLQGRKTNRESPRRLKEAIDKGNEVYETLLNYRRDGRPFINVLMIAPLYDRNDRIKYHIGAQVDVTALVEGGRALPGFQRFLNRRDQDRKREQRENARWDITDEQARKSRSLARLRDLSEMFDLEESAIVRETSRANSLTRETEDNGSIASADRQRTPRRVLADSDGSDDEEATKEDGDGNLDLEIGGSGNGKLSGKLPGIYDTFLLFRPYPSLRIVFLSPKLRKYENVLQTPMLSHIGAPGGILGGLSESLKSGVPVSAKVHFMPERGVNRDGTKLKRGTKHEDGKYGKAVWISCTPLVGSDDRIGVWMCVVVEKSKVTGLKGSQIPVEQNIDQPVKSLNDQDGETWEGKQADESNEIKVPENNFAMNEKMQDQNGSARRDIPIKPVRINSETVIKGVAEQSPEPPVRRLTDNETAALNEETDPEPKTEDENHPTQVPEFDSKEQHHTSESQVNDHPNKLVDDAKPLDVSSAEKSNSSQSLKPYSVDSPRHEMEHGSDHDSQTDEYVTTRYTAQPAQSNNRVLIEDDNDVLANDDMENEQHEQERSGSTSPAWSPVSDVARSIPSDAQFSNGEEFSIGDSASQKREKLRSPEPPAPMEEKESSQDTADRQGVVSDTAKANDHPVGSSVMPTPTTPQQEARPPGDGEEEEEEEETLVSRDQTDSERNSRPTTAIDTRMDYLKAGSGRWQQGRNPRRVDLTQENFHLAGLQHRDGDGDGDDWSSDVECARSPYSVD